MRLKPLAITLAATALFMSGLIDARAQEEKWAVVDIVKLMKESAPGKAGVKYIEERQAEMQKELDAIQEKMEKNPTDQELMQELQKVYASSNQRIQAEGQHVANTLLDAVRAAMDKYRVDNGYTMLIGIEALASFAPEKDVTDEIMKEVNNSKLEFKQMPEPQEKAPEAVAPPAEKKESTPAKTNKTPPKNK